MESRLQRTGRRYTPLEELIISTFQKMKAEGSTTVRLTDGILASKPRQPSTERNLEAQPRPILQVEAQPRPMLQIEPQPRQIEPLEPLPREMPQRDPQLREMAPLEQLPLEMPYQEDDDERIQWRPIPLKLVYFSQFTGMPIVQVNGQRFYGPPRDYNEQPPPRGSEVFVGAIPRDADETELVPLFGSVGKIYQIRLMMDFSGTNRGFCFVQYFSPVEATMAINKLNKFEIRPGKRIGVFRSVENNKLHLSGVARVLTARDIYEDLSRVSPGVVTVSLIKRVQTNDGQFNTAIVEYESHRTAAMARRYLIPGGHTINGYPVNIEWAAPNRFK